MKGEYQLWVKNLLGRWKLQGLYGSEYQAQRVVGGLSDVVDPEIVSTPGMVSGRWIRDIRKRLGRSS